MLFLGVVQGEGYCHADYAAENGDYEEDVADAGAAGGGSLGRHSKGLGSSCCDCTEKKLLDRCWRHGKRDGLRRGLGDY